MKTAKNLFAALVMATSLVSGYAYAGQNTYICTIGASSIVDSKGLTSFGNEIFVGKQFFVDRSTGKMIGEPINTNGYVTQVISSAVSGNAFEMVAINQFRTAMYLGIQDFADRVDKPFVLAGWFMVYSGSCQ